MRSLRGKFDYLNFIFIFSIIWVPKSTKVKHHLKAHSADLDVSIAEGHNNVIFIFIH